MLKSFTLTPSTDILSYKDHKEYPYSLFPSLVFVYNRRSIIKIDSRDLAILYSITRKKNIVNNFVFNFSPIENPNLIIQEEPNNHKILKTHKFNKITQLLPFPTDINILIINLIKEENLKWKITKQRKCKPCGLSINTYSVTNEQNVPFHSLLTQVNFKFRKNLLLDSVVYGVFNPNSFKPFKINVEYIGLHRNGNIPIDSNKITKILFFTKKRIYNSINYSDTDIENSLIEDNTMEEEILKHMWNIEINE